MKAFRSDDRTDGIGSFSHIPSPDDLHPLHCTLPQLPCVLADRPLSCRMSALRPIRILGLNGSLRAKSYHGALLRYAAASIKPESKVTLDIYPSLDLPAYNDDLCTPDKIPASVTALKKAVSGADAILFGTPLHPARFPRAATLTPFDA
jgi:hypothetical protein